MYDYNPNIANPVTLVTTRFQFVFQVKFFAKCKNTNMGRNYKSKMSVRLKEKAIEDRGSY